MNVLLINALSVQTESLKVQYLACIPERASQEFLRIQQWIVDYRNGKFGFREASEAYHKLPNSILQGKSEAFINEQVELAQDDYENFILKLGDHLEKKNLNLENLTFITSHIGVNFEVQITDGVKTVPAYTIVAEGEIQRPYYFVK